MDLGCFDMGCIEKKPMNDTVSSSENSPSASTTATSKLGKTKATKEGGQSNLVSLNKSASQIRKPPHRKTSPINWFPRKKVDSYLKRKIKMLQEVDGMNSTLDETLGDANPHYCRVLREKIAVREAAQRAVEARKAALIEASWCRILQAARIDCKKAEQLLIKAERFSAEAFEAATAIGVILYDIPDCSQKHYKIEKSPAKGGGPTTHTVRTSFETAFEVDKQVATALKAALLKLANCPSMNKDEVKELLLRISQNPETDDNHQELSEFSSECESDTASEFESLCSEVTDSETKSVQRKYKKTQACEKFNMLNLKEMMLERLRCLQEDELASLATIVATCGLNAALAEAEKSKPHVSGSAANDKSELSVGGGAVEGYNLDGKTSRTNEELPSLDKFLVKRLTRLEREVLEAKNSRSEAAEKSEQTQDKSGNKAIHDSGHDLASILKKPSSKFEKEIEEAKNNSEVLLKSKFLVKRLTRLEREVLEAKNSRSEAAEKSEQTQDKSGNKAIHDSGHDLASILKKPSSKFEKEIEEAKNNSEVLLKSKCKASNSNVHSSEVPDFGSVLVKHSSKLEKEIEEAKRKIGEIEGNNSNRLGTVAIGRNKKHEMTVPRLEDYLVKHMTRLEKEVQEAKNRKNTAEPIANASETTSLVGKENVDQNVNHDTNTDGNPCNGEQPLKAAGKLSIEDENKEAADSLDKNLVKPVHRLQRLKMEESSTRSDYVAQRRQRKIEANGATNCESLDKILVKHVSKLEKEKMSLHAKEDNLMNVKKRDAIGKQMGNSEGSLDQILVKHMSRLEREKMAAVKQEDDDQVRHSVTRKETRERELQEAWGGLSLGNSTRPHMSRLQRDKAAWQKAEEEERKRIVEEV